MACKALLMFRATIGRVEARRTLVGAGKRTPIGGDEAHQAQGTGHDRMRWITVDGRRLFFCDSGIESGLIQDLRAR